MLEAQGRQRVGVAGVHDWREGVLLYLEVLSYVFGLVGGAGCNGSPCPPFSGWVGSKLASERARPQKHINLRIRSGYQSTDMERRRPRSPLQAGATTPFMTWFSYVCAGMGQREMEPDYLPSDDTDRAMRSGDTFGERFR